MIKQLDKIRKTPLFKGVKKEDFPDFLESLDPQLKNYQSDQTIFKAGQKLRRGAILIEGNIKLYKESFWNEMIEVDEIKEGQLFALSFASNSKLPSDISAITTCSSVILWFNIQDLFQTVLDESHQVLIQNILSSLAEQNIELNNKLLYSKRKTTREKILSYLSEQALLHHSNEFDIPLDRQQLANFLLVDRSAMSTELNKLQKEGYFTAKHNHFILYKL